MTNTRVTPETFIRAETDRMFYGTARQAGGVNRLYHFRTPTPLDKQTVIRMNLDTLYSMGVVDTVRGRHGHRTGDAERSILLGLPRRQRSLCVRGDIRIWNAPSCPRTPSISASGCGFSC